MTKSFDYLFDSPPSPFLPIAIFHPFDDSQVVSSWARVDTGADRTVVPLSMIEPFGLSPIRSCDFEDYFGRKISLSLYRIRLAIENDLPHWIDVASSDGEACVLLGRDFINEFRLLFDGPNRKLEIL